NVANFAAMVAAPTGPTEVTSPVAETWRTRGSLEVNDGWTPRIGLPAVSTTLATSCTLWRWGIVVSDGPSCTPVGTTISVVVSEQAQARTETDRKSTRLNSSHV